ncbi:MULTISPECIES: virulence factor [Legionella]|uniref:Virulence factor n=1 Tax=Legionella septentrionalis TaxID=2498109 RepID=A0A433JLM6_9GAMM|nr:MULTISPECIES: virulence factor [Legionella]MCP0913924.1 virulence factor [Legionella sp. 27cVA30]RUQ90412.1 virulence factor [Legionella septentrionalis]RUR00063.1 virulence factor [Legionella septentrionalis]RUR10759.1 virulence factor [Legionella septentrionalis]RUR16488.1 virulence factor [Legionella septentrionalis]
MADPKDFLPEDFEQLAEEQRKLLREDEEYDPIAQIEKVYQIWWHWADFHLFIVSPSIFDTIAPPKIIPPEILEDGTREFVYTIHDHGYKLSASKGEDMYIAGMSMCKLYYTIEKMIYLLVEKLKAGEIGTETEVQVAFGGHELAQRKAFESIINLLYNVVVTNFDPGIWGERYLQTVKRLSDQGYGYPTEAPRTPYRTPRISSSPSKR